MISLLSTKSFRFSNDISDGFDVQRRQNPGPAYIIDLDQACVPKYLDMPVDSPVVFLQITCDGGYVQRFGAIHKHKQDPQPHRVSESPEHVGCGFQIIGR